MTDFRDDPLIGDQAGIDAVNAWGDTHPMAVRTIKFGTLCGLLWLFGLVWHVFQAVACLLAIAWLGGLVIMHWKTPWVLPLIQHALANTRRFWSWAMAFALGRLFAWRSGDRRTAEIAAEEESVQRALALDTAEADAQLAAQRHAFATQLDALNAKTGRTYHEEMQLAHLGRMIRSIDAGRFGPTLIERPMAELGEVGQRRGFLGSIASGGIMQWVAVGGVAFGLTGWGAAAVQGLRLNNAKSDLSEARASIDGLSSTLESRTAERDILAANIIEASQGAQEAAETINHERARNAAARRRERELVREIQERTADVGDPPTWNIGDGLRDDASSNPAGPGDSASGNPG